jgi:hypothetical protein
MLIFIKVNFSKLQFKDVAKELNEEISKVKSKTYIFERTLRKIKLETNINEDYQPKLLKEKDQTESILLNLKNLEDYNHKTINESIWMTNHGVNETILKENKARKSLSNIHQDLRFLNTHQDSNQMDQNELIKLISKFTKNLQKSQVKYDKIEEKRKIKKQWRLLSEIVDRLLFYIFLSSTLIILLAIINQAPNAKVI